MAADMDLTNLDPAMSDEVYALLKEIERDRKNKEELESELSSTDKSVLRYKSMYEDQVVTLNAQFDAVKLDSDDTSASMELEAANLKMQIEALETEMYSSKFKSDALINDLKSKLEEIKVSKPESACKNFNDSEIWNIEKENNDLKIELVNTNETVDKLESTKLDCTKRTTVLESGIKEITEKIEAAQRSARETNAMIQEKLEEKAIMMSTLNQINSKPLAELNQKESLYNEMNNRREEITSEYESLKEKFIKSKESLAELNADITIIKDDSSKSTHVFRRLENKSKESLEDIVAVIHKTSQTYEKLIEQLNSKIGKLKNQPNIVINRSNFSSVNRFTEEAKVEEERLCREAMKIFGRKLSLDPKYYQLKRDLKNNLKKLKDIIDENTVLENQLNQCNKENSAHPPSVVSSGSGIVKKSIRFAEEVKYEDES